MLVAQRGPCENWRFERFVVKCSHERRLRGRFSVPTGAMIEREVVQPLSIGRGKSVWPPDRCGRFVAKTACWQRAGERPSGAGLIYEKNNRSAW